MPVPPFLCATPFPSCFPHSGACVSAMWLNVLSGLCSVRAARRRRLRGAPAGLDWASSPRWSWHGSATLSFFTPVSKCCCFPLSSLPTTPPLQLLSHRSCKLAFACLVTAENPKLGDAVTQVKRLRSMRAAVVVVSLSFFCAHFFFFGSTTICFLCILHCLVHACICQAEMSGHCSSRAVLTGNPGTVALADLSD